MLSRILQSAFQDFTSLLKIQTKSCLFWQKKHSFSLVKKITEIRNSGLGIREAIMSTSSEQLKYF